MLEYFESWIGTKAERPFSINLNNIGVQARDISELDTPISPEEVKQAINDINSDKAPGPDGFTALFFKSTWDLIHPDIMKAVKDFEKCRAGQLHLLNAATIVLLPKYAEAMHPKEFRPISLVNFFAKLLTKILAKRLSTVMD